MAGTNTLHTIVEGAERPLVQSGPLTSEWVLNHVSTCNN